MRLYIISFITIISLGVFTSPCLAQGVFSGLIISEKKDGIKIVEVQSGSPGFDAGLRTGDIVLEIDGKETKKLRDYVKISKELKGKKVEVPLPWVLSSMKIKTGTKKKKFSKSVTKLFVQPISPSLLLSKKRDLQLLLLLQFFCFKVLDIERIVVIIFTHCRLTS